MKKKLVLALALVIFLSGCTLPIFGKITEIVYQEDKKINNLQEFLTEAQAIADKKIGGGAKAKQITYAYFNNAFSYSVAFAKEGEYLKDNILKNITVSYNQDWKVKKQGSFSGHEPEMVVNNKLIAVECNRTIMCSTGIANTLADPKNNIDLNSIVFDLNNLINDKYLTGSNFGFIKTTNGVPIGNFGRFRFNATTIDGDIMDITTDDKSKWYKKNTGSDLNSSSSTEQIAQASTSADTNSDLADIIKLNFDNDSDKDGLTDLQELAYETNPKVSDTDGDGYADNDEINKGYNPLGPGKLVSDDCSGGLVTTDKCYLEIAISEKDLSLCKKISTNSEIIKCLFKINFITKNKQVCEDINKAEENTIDDFYNLCLEELSDIVNPTTSKINRDAKTISDIKQIQTALELYYNYNNSYPPSLETLTTGDRIQMSVLPVAVKGETDFCANDYNYKYTFISREEYSLTYCIDGLADTAKNMGVIPGINTASQNGIK